MISIDVSFSEPLPLHYPLEGKIKNRLRFFARELKNKISSLYRGVLSLNNKLTGLHCYSSTERPIAQMLCTLFYRSSSKF
ncbi:MAG TPA: hypothetical protein VE467_20865, partial [Chryseolinea sp.]|nr:hypothetical protein [Chryseolinea sp.]